MVRSADRPAGRRVLPVVPGRRRVGLRRAPGRPRAAPWSARASSTAPARPITSASPWYNLTNGSSRSPCGWGCDAEGTGTAARGAGAARWASPEHVALWWFADQRYDDAVATWRRRRSAATRRSCSTAPARTPSSSRPWAVSGRSTATASPTIAPYDLGDDDTPGRRAGAARRAGRRVDLDPANGPTYDSDGAKGTGVSTAEIEDTGDYVLTASSDDPEAVIRVGRDPSSGVAAMRAGAVGVLIAGIGLFCSLGIVAEPPAAAGGRRRPGCAAVAVNACGWRRRRRSAVRQPAGRTAVRHAASTAAPLGRWGHPGSAWPGRWTAPAAAVAALTSGRRRRQRRRMTVTTRP